MNNGRCRMHDDKSTGTRTKEGLEKIRNANLRNGFYTKEAIKEKNIC